MNWIILLIYLLSMAVFTFFSLIAIKHAARFRYLSTRTVYLTIFYVSATSALALISLISILAVMLWSS